MSIVRNVLRKLLVVPILIVAVVGVVAGLYLGNLLLIALGAALGCWQVGRLALLRTQTERVEQPAADEPSAGEPVDEVESPVDDEPPQDSDSLVETLQRQGRFALLLRPQIISRLSEAQSKQTVTTLHESMALVPAGEVFLAQPSVDEEEQDEGNPFHGNLVHLEPALLDRCAVTNREYRRFILAGGMEDPALWDPKIWPGVQYFTDRTGKPGPRFWTDGCFGEGLGEHPVVGVSWYEAAAYARWVGKRLPSDAEWVKAGSWPVADIDGPPMQRKYPWGETLQAGQANLWGWGPRTTVAVTEFAEGDNPVGLRQLIGNVWEWTSSGFGQWHPSDVKIEAGHPLKSIRGGAFDTYFDGHACCQFQSGDAPLARKHNIGFRCALSLCDLAPVAVPEQQRELAAV